MKRSLILAKRDRNRTQIVVVSPQVKCRLSKSARHYLTDFAAGECRRDFELTFWLKLTFFPTQEYRSVKTMIFPPLAEIWLVKNLHPPLGIKKRRWTDVHLRFLVRVARLELTATSCGARNALPSLSLGAFRPLRLSLARCFRHRRRSLGKPDPGVKRPL